MMFCSGAPNSPAAAIRFSISASPNIFLRRRRPRAYNSLVSTGFTPPVRSMAGLYGQIIVASIEQARFRVAAISCAGPICPYKFVREETSRPSSRRSGGIRSHQMIHAAIAGLGRWGHNLVEASLGHERLKIVRAVEPDIKAARSFCGQHRLELTDRLETVL